MNFLTARWAGTISCLLASSLLLSLLTGCGRSDAVGRDKGLPVGMVKWAGSGTDEVEAAARRGDAGAQYVLGWRYYHGEGVGVDQDLGLRWLRQAASNNVSEAQLQLGILEEHGIGRPVDRGAALGWYERAARGSNVVAEYRAGELYLGQAGISNHFALGTNWLGKAAGAGYGPAQAALARIYAQVLQPSPVTNKSVADHWGYAVRGRSDAQNAVASGYEAIDPAEFYKWLWLSAHNGEMTAKARLEEAEAKLPRAVQLEGRKRAAAFVPDPLPAWSRELYEHAAQKGDAMAQFELAKLIIYSEDVHADKAESYKWLLLAGDQGHALAKNFERTNGGRYSPEEQQEGLRRARRFHPDPVAPEWRHSDSLLHFFPSDSLPASSQMQQLQTAAAAGQMEAQLRLGLYYLHESLQRSSQISQREIYQKYFIPPVIPVSGELSRHWLDLAARQGHPDAQLLLAFTFFNQPLNERKLGETRRWLEKAANTRTEAKYQLARFLESQGGNTNYLADQLKYYRLAAENGHEPARVALQRRQTKLGGGVTDAGQVFQRTQSTKDLSSAGTSLRLGIVISEPALADVADLLTARLSQEAGVTLVERSQLEKIFREQALNRTQQNDLLKLGQLLAADGLVLLEVTSSADTPRLLLRTIAVRPGVVLGEYLHPWPLKDLTEWQQFAVRQTERSLFKMSVKADAAIPLSILNLRTAISTPGSREMESKLTWLLTHRLIQQPELFVLERTRLQKLARESEISATDSAFWHGSYTLEGVINRDSIAGGTTTIDIKLASPRMTPLEFRVTGAADQPDAIIEQVASHVTAALSLKQVQRPTLNALEEAAVYYDEARWALRWGLYPEAQQASEASRALGLRLKEMSPLLVQSYLDPAILYNQPYRHSMDGPLLQPPTDAYAFNCAVAGTDLALKLLEQSGNSASLEQSDRDLCENTLSFASAVLRNQCLSPTLFQQQHEELARLRDSLADLAGKMDRFPECQRVHPGNSLPGLTLRYGCFWAKDFTRARKLLETQIDRGCLHEMVAAGPVHYSIDIIPFSWAAEERPKAEKLMRQWMDDLTLQSGIARPEAGFYFFPKDFSDDYAFEDQFLSFINYLKRNKSALLSGQISTNTWTRVASITVDKKDRFVVARLMNKEFVEGKKLIEAVWDYQTEQEQAGIKEAKAEQAKKEAMARAALEAREAEAKAKHARQMRDNFETIRTALKEGLNGRKYAWVFINSLGLNTTFTPEQARELEPLLTEYEHKLGKDAVRLSGIRLELKLTLKSAVNTPAPKPVVAAAPVKLQMPYADKLIGGIQGCSLSLPVKPGESVEMEIVGYGFGRLYGWFEIVSKKVFDLGKWQRSLLRVDLNTLQTTRIAFPDDGQLSDAWLSYGGSMVLHQETVYLTWHHRLLRLESDQTTWAETGVTLPDGCRLFSVNGRLLASTSETILLVDEPGKTTTILASTRRRPAINILDSVGDLKQAVLFAGPKGELCIQVGPRLFNNDFHSQQWSETSVPDPEKWTLIPVHKGMLFLDHTMIGGDVLGTDGLETKPAVWLGAPPEYRRGREKPRWAIPSKLYAEQLRFSEISTAAKPSSAHRDQGSLWAFFSHARTFGGPSFKIKSMLKNSPYLLVCSDWEDEPLVLPLGLLPPKEWADSASRTIILNPNRDFVTELSEQHFILLSFNPPAFWAVPRERIKPASQQQAAKVELTKEQRRLQLIDRQKQWQHIYDQNHDGKLDELEMRAMNNNARYQQEMEELQDLEKSHKAAP